MISGFGLGARVVNLTSGLGVLNRVGIYNDVITIDRSCHTL